MFPSLGQNDVAPVIDLLEDPWLQESTLSQWNVKALSKNRSYGTERGPGTKSFSRLSLLQNKGSPSVYITQGKKA